MPTLNQLAERVVRIVNQPENHELKERVKDMIKTGMANRIRQSSEKHGIDDILKVSMVAPVKEITEKEILDYPYIILNGNNKYYITTDIIPTPVRIINDAPFTLVGDFRGRSFRFASPLESRFLHTSSPTGSFISYSLINNKLLIQFPRQRVSKTWKNTNQTSDRTNLTEIKIEGIFENPEEVLLLYQDVDGQDINLPFPLDMLENIIQEILKTEFGLIPKDNAIVVNPLNTNSNG